MRNAIGYLPSIEKTKREKNHKKSDIKKQLAEDCNPFKTKMEKVMEVKIFLKHNFHKTDIDDNFLSDLDRQYAVQYLERMELLPTKSNISKLLKIKPIEKCDFSLTVEHIRNKPIKLLHIYPNPKQSSGITGLKGLLSNEEFEKAMNKTFFQGKDRVEDKLTQIKSREIKKDEINLYMPEIIENTLNKARDDILDTRLYIQSDGIIDQNEKIFDLSINAIREKYIKPKPQIMLGTNDVNFMTTKAKLQNIEKAVKKDFINSDKYNFPFLDIDLNKEILKEVNKPLEVPIETIMKDINYILDNFPIDKLINLEEPTKKIDLLNVEKSSGDYFLSSGIFKRIQNTYNDPSKINQYFKIKSVSRKDLLLVYKKIQSPPIYRIIGLLVNLLYWIVFGYLNRIQIDKFTKQHLFFKILEEMHQVEIDFGSKKIYDKIFMPILIIILRIECEAIFHKKMKIIFENEDLKEKAMNKINEIITIVFDPNSYFLTFTILSSDMSKLKHKISKKLYPNYKSNVHATSNLVNQLFTKMGSVNIPNSKKESNKEGELDSKYNNKLDWEKEKNYIEECKVQFYKVLLNKINQNLKRRNLDPIFNLPKESISLSTQVLKVEEN
jgi:hypothetical protein